MKRQAKKRSVEHVIGRAWALATQLSVHASDTSFTGRVGERFWHIVDSPSYIFVLRYLICAVLEL